MATTQAQADVMERTAARFEQVNDALQATLSRLMAQLDGLHSQWQGAGARSFEQARQAWAADQSRLQHALLQTSTSIRTAGRRYLATDAEAGARLSGTGRTHLELPL